MSSSDKDEDEDIFDEEDGVLDGEDVQLGFLEPCAPSSSAQLFLNPDWHAWDGGKVGGRPVWLNPRDLPLPADVACPTCSSPTVLLLQIYSPIDDFERAFHRAVYIFSCRKPACVEANGVRALRCQLPRANSFYSYEPDDAAKSKSAASSSKGGRPEAYGRQLCAVCGCRGDSQCSQCRIVAFCGREHQKAAWKAGHKQECKPIAAAAGDAKALEVKAALEGAASESAGEAASAGGAAPPAAASAPVGVDASMRKNTAASPLLFPEFEIVVEPENDASSDDAKGASAAQRAKDEAELREKLEGLTIEDAETAADDEDRTLTQANLDEMTGASAAKDPQTLAFLARVNGGGGGKGKQVLRYARWGAGRPLWISSEGLPPGARPVRAADLAVAGGASSSEGKESERGEEGEAKVPPCENCGAPRRFEFQVMPQLLYYLGVENATQGAQRNGGAAAANGGGGGCCGSSNLRNLFAKGSTIDWGVLAVYTCTASCDAAVTTGAAESSSASAYLEEYVWRQPPLA